MEDDDEPTVIGFDVLTEEDVLVVEEGEEIKMTK